MPGRVLWRHLQIRPRQEGHKVEKIRTAIIGCGNRSQGHAEAARTGGVMEIVYACDAISERAEQRAREWGAKAARDYRESLVDASVEAVIIVTNVESHLPITHEALAAGKHVIVEKPMGDDVKAARQLVAQAEATDRVAYVSFQMRFNPRQVRLKSAAEKIDPVQILFERQRGMMKPQFLNDGPFCGVSDVVAHDFDQVVWLMGRTPLAVMAVIRRNTFTEDTGTADTLSALLDFGDGRSAVVFSSIGAEEVGSRFDIIGACGNISLGSSRQDSAVRFERYNVQFGKSPGRTAIDLTVPEKVNADAALQKAFVEEIRTGKKSQAARLSDGLNSLLITLGCLKSAREQRRVVLEEL